MVGGGFSENRDSDSRYPNRMEKDRSIVKVS